MEDVPGLWTLYCENSAEKHSTFFAVSPFTPAFTQYAERPDQTVGALWCVLPSTDNLAGRVYPKKR